MVKRYTCRDGEARVKGLEAHYYLLRAKLVPNVDQLLYAFDNTVVLTPRGIACEPKSEIELRQCLGDTIYHLHRAIALDVASEAGEAFGPLKAVLGMISTIYENYEVRIPPSLEILP